MDKVVNVYVQKYRNKYKITIEIKINKWNLVKGLHKVFRLYSKKFKKLEEENKLIGKSSLQYNGTHLLQLQCENFEDVKDMIDKLSDLEYCEVTYMCMAIEKEM